MAGVEVRDAGVLQQGGRFHIDHIDAYLNPACGNNVAVAVMGGFGSVQA